MAVKLDKNHAGDPRSDPLVKLCNTFVIVVGTQSSERHTGRLYYIPKAKASDMRTSPGFQVGERYLPLELVVGIIKDQRTILVYDQYFLAEQMADVGGAQSG